MTKSELTAALREHLAGKESIANEAAPALKLMRYALVELEKPTSNGGTYNEDADALRKDLASSERYVKELVDALNDREGYLYALLAEARMVPEVDDEPVGTLGEALERAPTLLDDLQEYVTNLINDDAVPATSDDKDRFINGVRELLDNVVPNGTSDLSLQGLWDSFETASRRYASLEEGLIERDKQLQQADTRISVLSNIIKESFEAAGLPFNTIEDLPAYRLQAHICSLVAQLEVKELVRADVPADAFLKDILEQCITILRLDWQDVETLPQHVQKLQEMVNSSRPAPIAVPDGWVIDAIDLAHAVRGNLAPENRVMAKAAEAIIAGAPRGAE